MNMITKKMILTLILIAVSCVSLAASCTYCQTTMPLRKVNGRYYCNKHYCAKHKEISCEGKCYRCDLESRVSRNKAKCEYCSNTKKLTIAKSEEKYKAFCQDHYCAKHKCAFSKSYREGTYCSVCKREIILLEEAKKADERAKELRAESVKIAAEIEELKMQRESLRSRMSEPLTGLFGVELNASPESINVIPMPGASDIYIFTPKKLFREFKRYVVEVTDGRVCRIRASRRFDSMDESEAEFDSVVELLDKKYGRERRGKVEKHGLYDMQVNYDFGCDENLENPKQGITVILTRTNAADYNVSISAFEVSVIKKMIERKEQNDIDAL